MVPLLCHLPYLLHLTHPCLPACCCRQQCPMPSRGLSCLHIGSGPTRPAYRLRTNNTCAQRRVHAGVYTHSLSCLPAIPRSQAAVRNGALHITQEGRCQKFVQRVEEVTFAAASAGGRSIRYVTERAVFGLLPGPRGDLQLLEVAPGVDVERDVLAHMAFRPAIGEVGVMDPRIFDSAAAAVAASS